MLTTLHDMLKQRQDRLDSIARLKDEVTRLESMMSREYAINFNPTLPPTCLGYPVFLVAPHAVRESFTVGQGWEEPPPPVDAPGDDLATRYPVIARTPSGPIVRGVWVRVADIVADLADGKTWAEVMAARPGLDRDDIRQAIGYTLDAGELPERPDGVPWRDVLPLEQV
jgi:uncharacterized protein (DUF433 family)